MSRKPLVTLALLASSLLPASAFASAPQVTIGKTPDGAKMVDAKTSADGTIHLLFQKNDKPFYATSTDGGKSVTPSIPVIKSAPAIKGLEFSGWDHAVTPEGKVIVVMSNNGWKLKLPKEDWGMYMAVLEPKATAFEPLRALNGMPSEGFSIAAGPNGSVTAGWLSGKLYWKHSIDGGKTFDANQEIDAAYKPCPCCTTSTTYGKDGSLAMIYREPTGDRRDIYLVLSKDGKHTRTRISQTTWDISACPMTYFKIAPANDGYVAAWPTRGQAYFARITADGKLWKPGEINVGGRTGMRSSVFALAGADNTTLVAWKNDDTLHWKIYDAEGKQIGEEGQHAGAGPQSGGVVDKAGNYILFP